MSKPLLLCILAAAALATAVSVGQWWPTRAPRPNILLVTLDTVRADRLGSYGHAGAATPALDRLAQTGVRFESAFSSSPLTLPSHASLLTGLQPPTHGLTDNGMRASRFAVPTLAERLRDEHYDTAAFVAAYVLNSIHGLDRGFGHYDDGPDAAGDVFSLFRATAPASERVDRLLEWLRRPREQPFFAWLHLFDAHAPYQPQAGFAKRFAASPYDGEIAYLDTQIARVIASLERAGIAEDTLVIVTADHGEGLGEHGEVTHGIFLYDSTLRVPLILRWPARLEPRVVDAPAALVDVVPTLLAMLRLPAQPIAHGVDLFESEPADAPWRFFALSDYPRRQYGWSALMALREGGLKYIASPRPELYDLRRDPAERDNLVAAAQAPSATRLADQIGVGLEEMHRQGLSDGVATDPTAQQRRELQSLGYVSSGVRAAAPSEDPIDPKDGLPTLGPIEQAFEALAKGDLAQAETLFRATLVAMPDGHAARDGLARTLELAGRDAEAEVLYRQIVAEDPEALLSLARLLVIALRREDCDGAREFATRLSELLPDARAVDEKMSACTAPASAAATGHGS